MHEPTLIANPATTKVEELANPIWGIRRIRIDNVRFTGDPAVIFGG